VAYWAELSAMKAVEAVLRKELAAAQAAKHGTITIQLLLTLASGSH
jgi:hypothetical protein